MHGRTARAGVFVSLLLLGVSAGCYKGYRQVVVIDGAKAETITVGPAPKEPQGLWVPDRVLVFRTTSPVPGAPTKAVGTAGHVYRLDDDLNMKEIGTFELSIPNDTLAYRWGG